MPKGNVRRILIDTMSVSQCSGCGSGLLPEARFCRQCGASVTSNVATDSSELPTAILNRTTENVTTNRLEPRPTSSDPRSLKAPAPVSISTNMPVPRRRVATWISGAVLLIIIIGIISSVAYVRNRSHSRTTDSSALVYPGSQTIVDMQGEGYRTLHFQTLDSLEQVVAWYETNLKPTKTMRLTSTSVILKNQNVTATIATEDNRTNILIKQSLKP